MEKRVLVSVLVLLGILNLVLFFNTPSSYIEIGGQRFAIEVANTPESLQEGLMFREVLCADCGMLFVFPDSEQWNFWMKNTLIPLDMVFISEDKTVVDVKHAVPCESSGDDCPRYIPREPAKYVLEVNADSFDESVIGEPVRIVV